MQKKSVIILSVVCSAVFILGLCLTIMLVLINKTAEPLTPMTKSEFLEVYTEISADASLELPIIEINTQGGELPKDKENYINCSFKISNTKDGLFDVEKPLASSPKSQGGVGIRLRGNSTMLAGKKPYRIKFNEKTSIMGQSANKSWVLLADAYDNSKIRNYSGFSLAKQLENSSFTPTHHHVVLFINNTFQGLYLLTDQIDENAGRTNVKSKIEVGDVKDFPFLVEIDFNKADNYFVVDADSELYAEIKYPEKEDFDSVEDYNLVSNYIKEYIKAIWSLLKNGNKTVVSFKDNEVSLEELIDVDSMVDYYLVNEIMENSDAGRSSTYISKKLNEKAEFGPVWDFDIKYGDYNNTKVDISNRPLFVSFLSNESYYDKICNRYNDIKVLVPTLIEDLKVYKQKIMVVAYIDSCIWNLSGEKFIKAYDVDIERLAKRYEFLNQTFKLSHVDFVGMYL